MSESIAKIQQDSPIIMLEGHIYIYKYKYIRYRMIQPGFRCPPPYMCVCNVMVVWQLSPRQAWFCIFPSCRE